MGLTHGFRWFSLICVSCSVESFKVGSKCGRNGTFTQIPFHKLHLSFSTSESLSLKNPPFFFLLEICRDPDGISGGGGGVDAAAAAVAGGDWGDGEVRVRSEKRFSSRGVEVDVGDGSIGSGI
ncbi:hypothetical protein Scep_030170 [Stephania cephalantha]|uniref:Caspase family p20 domain-containing protein n=1 Tax=Stephania cephalantha TaxID=152367 RepID=A0AAP0HE39_9MAGN